MPAILPVSSPFWGSQPMGRQAKLRQKGVYWASDAGGKTTYFGRVTEVPHAVAMCKLHEHLANLKTVSKIVVDVQPGVDLTVNELAERFLNWVLCHRGTKAHKERSRHLQRFRESFGDMLALELKGTHLEAFVVGLKAKRHALDYVQKHVISIGAMYRKRARKGWLPGGFQPFASVEPIRLLPKTLTESALLTDAEIKALLSAAEADSFGPMGDMIRLYHATGARTHELIAVRAGEVQRVTRPLVLGHHKCTHTLKEPRPRQVYLNETAFGIMARRCDGLPLDAYVFQKPSGGAFSNANIAERFQTVRKRAGVRSSITIYSFRHLWISEMLMAGVDVLLVARMAGTSVAMIERVYGHFRNQSYQEAQASSTERGRHEGFD